MPTPEEESLDINKEMQRRLGRASGKWNRRLHDCDLDSLAAKHPAIQEKLEELATLLKLCK